VSPLTAPPARLDCAELVTASRLAPETARHGHDGDSVFKEWGRYHSLDNPRSRTTSLAARHMVPGPLRSIDVDVLYRLTRSVY
jgi:hypothetical protein